MNESKRKLKITNQLSHQFRMYREVRNKSLGNHAFLYQSKNVLYFKTGKKN